MSLRINTNITSAFSSYQLQKNQADLSGSLQRLSTGKRINKASDDAASMVIANKLASQSRGFGQAIRNANDAISITQVADGALGQATDLIQDIRVNAIQAASAAQSRESRLAIQADIGKSLESLRDIAQNTSFNGQKLLSGAFTDKQFQVGASSGEIIEISLGSIDPSQISDETLGALADIDVTTQEGAQAAIELTDIALDYISQQRSQAGSSQNQLESTINNLSNARINTLSAESEIRDLDYAEESINLNKIKLLSKARTFALAQSNTTAKQILDIFE
ncbi:MAG: flagellin [Desulfobacula sp.]|uniref:flagellin N-terminal helical domain-containing protein n=1 Tax=Desulfobacula sp. TaxID=2593537 RepID=UPI0025BCAAFF|nr:flagellin [Desulfobacula sp.]MCD4720323.1 flagellin [Desulfobacula sp.]